MFSDLDRTLMEDEDPCAICQESFANDNEKTNACENHHAFHSHCLSHWFQTQADADQELVCPCCKTQGLGWRSVTVKKLSGAHVRAAVRSDFTALDLKKQLGWSISLPTKCMRIIKHGDQVNARLEQVNDEAPIGAGREFSLVIRFKSAELLLLLDIPRCAAASDCLKCPISKGLLLHPVRGADGIIYERAAIEWWIERNGDRSPINNRDINPIIPVKDEELISAVRAIQPDFIPQISSDEEITVELVVAKARTRFIKVRLSDTFSFVVRLVMPNATRVVYGDHCMSLKIPCDASLARGGVKNGDILYVSS
jgi:hypothetical protein